MTRVSAQQIAAEIRERISAGEYPPGSALPSESEIVTRYDTSKATARAAMEILRNDGWTIGQPGKGIFVRTFTRYTRHGSTRHLRSQRPEGLTPTQAEAQAQGLRHDLTLIDVEQIPAAEPVAGLLQVEVGTPLIRRRHLITLDGEPTQLADSYFIADLVQGTDITREEPIPGGVHSALAAVLGTALTHASEVLTARMPTPAEKTALGLYPGTPVVDLTRTVHASDRPVEVTVWLFDASRIRFAYDVPMD